MRPTKIWITDTPAWAAAAAWAKLQEGTDPKHKNYIL
jgi:hypothetical protein